MSLGAMGGMGGMSVSSVGGLAGGVLASGGALVGGLFGKRKAEPVVYNKQLRDLTYKVPAWLEADNDLAEGDLAAYKTANDARIKNTSRLAGLAEADFNSLLQTNRNYDPVASHDRILASQTGALKDMMKIGGFDAGRREADLASAALGYGGRPSGSYEKALLYDRVARAYAPQFGSIINNLASNYGIAEQSRAGNLADTVALINARTGTADYGAGLELNPMNARLAYRSGQLGNMGALADVSAANTAGWREDKNWAAKLGDSMESAGGYIMQGSAVGSGGGGGMGGGMGGMGGGGFGGFGRATPSNFTEMSPAEIANYLSYQDMVRNYVPRGSRWE